MNRNLHSPTKLTEFARDFDIEPDTFFTKFVNKITNVYNSGYNTVNVVPSRTSSQQRFVFDKKKNLIQNTLPSIYFLSLSAHYSHSHQNLVYLVAVKKIVSNV